MPREITAHQGASAPSTCPGLKLTDARAAAATKIVRIIIFQPPCGGLVITPRRLSLFQYVVGQSSFDLETPINRPRVCRCIRIFDFQLRFRRRTAPLLAEPSRLSSDQLANRPASVRVANSTAPGCWAVAISQSSASCDGPKLVCLNKVLCPSRICNLHRL